MVEATSILARRRVLLVADAPVLTAAAPDAALLHPVRRVSDEVDPLQAENVVGLTTDRLVASLERSSLLAGTAVHVRPGSFPWRSMVTPAERFGHLDRMDVEGGAGDADVFAAGRRRAVASFPQRQDQ